MEYLVLTRKGLVVLDESEYLRRFAERQITQFAVTLEMATAICRCTLCEVHFKEFASFSLPQNPEVSALDCFQASPNLGGASG